MAFHEVRLPLGISLQSRGGPGFSTSAVEGSGGGSERISRWSGAKMIYDLRYAVKTEDDMATLVDFYRARSGPAVGFRVKDDADFTTAANHRAAHTMTDVTLGVATGTFGTFQLRKGYSDGMSGTIYRTITKPVASTFLLSKTTGGGGPVQLTSNFSLDGTTGLLNISSGITAGDIIKAGFEYDVPCQFTMEVDKVLAPSFINFNAKELPSLPIEEMKGNVSSPERFYYGGGSNVTTGPFSVNFGLGAMIFYTGPGGSTAFMPDPTDLELGGPYFFITNGSAGTLDLRTYDGVTLILQLAANKTGICVAYPDASAVTKWGVISN